MAMSDRAFRALATREPEVVIATLRAVIPSVVGRAVAPMTPDDLQPTRLDSLAPPQDVDWLGLQDPDRLLHCESQGYRDPSFPERLFGYHLWLVLRYPKRRVHTVALWLSEPAPRYAQGVLERDDVRVRVSPVVVPRIPAEALLEDPLCACFAAGADRGTWSDTELCRRVAQVLRVTEASWNRRHMAVVAAAMQGRYNAMVEAMAHEHLEPVIIEDLVHIGEDLGYEKGRSAGHSAGLTTGEAVGRRETLRQILALRGVSLTEAQTRRLGECTDASRLAQWVERAMRGDDPADWLG